jgi:NitT/TauT family transport system permease protein
LLVWEAVTRIGALPRFILPPPEAVANRLATAIADGSLARHTIVTLSEVLAGLAIGLAAGVSLGYLLAKSQRAERLLSPYIVASQAIPVVAIAPLLVIWLGPGHLSKVLISALIVFFPILISTVAGIRSVPYDLRDLMRSLRATRRQTLRLLELPAAAPYLLGGLKIGSTLAVIGAVVGEFVGAEGAWIPGQPRPGALRHGAGLRRPSRAGLHCPGLVQPGGTARAPGSRLARDG